MELNPKKMKIIIDTDMMQDDWMALIYLLSHPLADILGICFCHTGIARSKEGIENIHKILNFLKRTDVKVFPGRKLTFSGEEHKKQGTIEIDKYMRLNQLNPITTNTESIIASEFMYQTLKDATDPLIIFAIGPLTNVAELLQNHSEIKSKIEMIYIMGGAVHRKGNITPHAEYNIFRDPLAANYVFHSGVPITMIPLDSTMQCPIFEESKFYQLYLSKYKDITNFNEVPANQGAALMTFRIMESLINEYWGVEMHDQLTAVSLMNPEVVEKKKRKLNVFIDGPEKGKTVEDQASGVEITYGGQVNREEFEKRFFLLLDPDIEK